jgi:hypothetical protein
MPSTELVAAVADFDGESVIQLLNALADDERASVTAALQQRGFHVHVIDVPLDAADLESALMNDLARGFAFPDYCGENWNAIDECMRDLEWLPADGYFCLLLHRDTLEQRIPQAFEIFLSVLRYASTDWKRQGKRLCLATSP